MMDIKKEQNSKPATAVSEVPATEADASITKSRFEDRASTKMDGKNSQLVSDRFTNFNGREKVTRA